MGITDELLADRAILEEMIAKLKDRIGGLETQIAYDKEIKDDLKEQLEKFGRLGNFIDYLNKFHLIDKNIAEVFKEYFSQDAGKVCPMSTPTGAGSGGDKGHASVKSDESVISHSPAPFSKMGVCKCGHHQSDHICCEGACRPGFICDCEKYTA